MDPYGLALMQSQPYSPFIQLLCELEWPSKDVRIEGATAPVYSISPLM